MTEFRPPTVGGGGRWALTLYLLPLPLVLDAVLSLWFGNFHGVLSSSIGYALFVAAAQAVRQGSQQEAAVRRRPRALARRWPWKSLGAVLAGIATAVTAAASAGHDLGVAVAFGVAAGLGARLVYGADPPLRAEAVAGAAGNGDDVQQALATAYGRLDRIEAIAAALPSREFQQRLRTIGRQLATLLAMIEQEPANFALSRRFLNVYLDHSLDVMEKYSRVFPRGASAELEHNFRSLLVDIENTCDQQHRSLVQRDLMDLDVQIEVLSQRLRQDGLR
ncbi:MAG: 5-bromo-4-chloroindolyl phosphate hydrolysis family protein [Rhodospirillales bacterium]|nr:5-bromo-4-chloroindolyl phosphate hydrolysis family protein [Rhodospirillales bacterium]